MGVRNSGGYKYPNINIHTNTSHVHPLHLRGSALPALGLKSETSQKRSPGEAIAGAAAQHRSGQRGDGDPAPEPRRARRRPASRGFVGQEGVAFWGVVVVASMSSLNSRDAFFSRKPAKTPRRNGSGV